MRPGHADLQHGSSSSCTGPVWSFCRPMLSQLVELRDAQAGDALAAEQWFTKMCKDAFDEFQISHMNIHEYP